MTLRTLNYGNYGIFLIMGNAGFCPSTVVLILVFPILLLQKNTFGEPTFEFFRPGFFEEGLGFRV